MANQEAFTVGSFNLEFYQALESTRQPEETFCLGNNDSLADVSAVPSQAATEGNASEELESVDKKLIKTLDGSVAKKICTGQVVISLAGACRELIDNALDAGASNIEIRTKENGADCLEVIDNGCGISEKNFENLCKPHSTSKMSSIEDFSSLTTFGFRGEALNALAALSEVAITTRNMDSRAGSRLSFSHSGDIVKRENCHRQVGTTVTISKLFKPIPVRRQELQRNSRREFLKLLSCVQSFALSSNCRFTCTNFVDGKQNILITSPPNASLREKISSLFGAKNDKSELLDIVESLPETEVKEMYGVQNSVDEIFRQIRLSGIVSSAQFGHGRSTADRQFVFVNQHPVDFPKLNRIANEVYSSFNRGKFCMLILFIETNSALLDVNVTPDKRQVFFHKEKELFAKLRSSLSCTFTKELGTCPKALNSSTSNKTPARIMLQTQMSDDGLGDLRDTDLESMHDMSTHSPSARSDISLCDAPSMDIARIQQKRKRPLVESAVGNVANINDGPRNVAAIIDDPRKLLRNNETPNSTRSLIRSPIRPSTSSTTPTNKITTSTGIEILPVTSVHSHKISESFISNVTVRDTNGDPDTSDQPLNISVLRPQQVLKIMPEQLQMLISKRYRNKKKILEKEDKERFKVEPSPDISDENQADIVAEQHLSFILSKNDFSKMKVIGQFNEAFIITRMGKQMFMIDQHAADEKYNFERLQKNSRGTSQKLIQPMILNLGAVEENILMDNIDILKANNFDFAFNDSDRPGNRIRLTAVPMIKDCQFDSNDVDEILNFLKDFPGTFYQPKKLQTYFASKACRSSVMFGKALHKQQMKWIVKHMGEMEKPWNCPHGRPTIRHIGDLRTIL